MASIDKRPNGRYLARYRQYPGGPQRTKTFRRKIDAETFLVDVQHRLLSGTYVAPEAGRITVAAYYQTWLARMAPTWRAGTLSAVEASFKHILPVLGRRPLSAVRRSDVEALCSTLTRRPRKPAAGAEKKTVGLPALAGSTVAVTAQHLGQMFRAAIDDGLLVTNPVYRARLPRNAPAKPQPVPLDVVARIEAALPDWLKVTVALGVGVGLRQGEVSGLAVDRIEFLRRTLRVDQQLIDRNVPKPVLAEPKTDSSSRTVPLADFVLDALSAHLARFPAEGGALVVRTPSGQPVGSGTFGHYWRRACREAGVPGLRFHALRHTFASTLLSRGVSVKAVADWLGHASPVITLTTYAHLMPADEDVARSVLDAALAPRAEDSLRTAGPGQAL